VSLQYDAVFRIGASAQVEGCSIYAKILFGWRDLNQPPDNPRRRRLTGAVDAYRFNDDIFAFESFPEEIVVLNLVAGTYYAFGGAAVVAWPYIITQHSVPVIASALATRYGVTTDQVNRDVTEFVERLSHEKILLIAPENTSEIDCSKLDTLPEYQGFTFERHADMEDLLTLDPIHDVDPQKGWPMT